jgi:predicted nuclease with TOPRIM domain
LTKNTDNLERKSKTTTYSTCRIIIIVLLKYLSGLNAVWEEEAIFNRIYELEEEYTQTQEYQELSAEYSQLFDRFPEIEAKKQRQEALFKFDSIMGSELTAAKKFYYQAGINDAMRIFNIL